MRIDKIRARSLQYAAGKFTSVRSTGASKKAKLRTKRRARRKLYEQYINSPEWAAFRMSVFAARGHRCESCGTQNGPLHVHHLHYRNFMKERPEDVKVLCECCHVIAHGKDGTAWQKLSQERRREIASMGGKARKAKREGQAE